jgi:hypothetical protein
MDLERRSSKPDVAGSSPAGAISILDFGLPIADFNFQIISGSSIGRTHRFER